MVKEFFQRFSKAPEAPAQESQIIKVLHTAPTGRSGSENYSGYPREEYLNTLQGRHRADLFDKMRRGDTIIQMCLGAVMYPILSACWEVEPFNTIDASAKYEKPDVSKEDAKDSKEIIPPEDTTKDIKAFAEGDEPIEPDVIDKVDPLLKPEDDIDQEEPTEEELEPWAQEDADLIKYILFEGMEKTWDEYLTEALTFLIYGHSVFELIDGVNFLHPKFGPINIIKNLGWRSPRTIEQWNLDPDTEKVTSIYQQAFGDVGKVVNIPGEFLQILSFRKEGANYEGISPLRACYGSWYRKQEYLKMNAIGIEKFAIPTPIVEIPANSSGTPDYERLIEVLENYVSHEKQYITHPVGYKFELKTNTYDPEKVERSIDSEDKRIVKGFLANFLNLDSGSGGSFALSNDLSDFFLSGIEHVATIICNSFNKHVIPRMIELNRGPRAGYPRLKVSGISDKAGEELANILDKLTGKKIITPDDMLEAHMRKRLGLPEMSLEGQRDASPPQPFGQPGMDPNNPDDPKEQKPNPFDKKVEIDPKKDAPKAKPKAGDPEEKYAVPKLAEMIRNLRA